MCKNNNTCLIAMAVSIIIAIAVALAFFNGFLPGIIFFVIASLILAGIATLVMVLVKGYRQDYCLCDNGVCMSVGIAGSLFFGAVALTIALTIGTILDTILIGLVGFFSALVLINLLVLLICISKNSCFKNEC